MKNCLPISLFLLITITQVACGQQKPAEVQIAEAIAALPPDMRDTATVLGYQDSPSEPVELRPGTNGMVCLADAPDDDRFHVACYHESLDPFMARGRALRADGKTAPEIEEIRGAEIEAGTLSFPDHAAALYSVTGGSLNQQTGEIEGGRSLKVVYVAYATTESTGLTTSPEGGVWLMYPGKPWAHVMITR